MVLCLHKCHAGNPFPVRLSLAASIWQLQNLIFKEKGFLPDKQVLSIAGAPLEKKDILVGKNIAPNSTIDLQLIQDMHDLDIGATMSVIYNPKRPAEPAKPSVRGRSVSAQRVRRHTPRSVSQEKVVTNEMVSNIKTLYSEHVRLFSCAWYGL